MMAQRKIYYTAASFCTSFPGIGYSLHCECFKVGLRRRKNESTFHYIQCTKEY
jgi:hypothetical protein